MRCEGLNGCPVGEERITPGFRLKADYVIRAVGPHCGDKDDAALLESA